MPGTHYDNDHSFIEALPAELRLVAHMMIRQDALPVLLQTQETLDSPLFEEYSHTPLTDRQKTDIIHSCLIAKITTFDRVLYLATNQQYFLENLFFDTLKSLLKPELGDKVKERQAIIKQLRFAHYRSYSWLNKTEEEERRTLSIRTRFKNTRRYFRYKAKIKFHFVKVSSQEDIDDIQRDIYTSGVKHFTKLVNERLDTLRENYHQNIEKALADPFPEAYQLFKHVIERVEYLRQVLNGISVGIIPIAEAKSALRKNIREGLYYDSLKDNIRTETILRDFENKIYQINENTLILLQNSTPHQLYEGPVLKKLKIDHDIEEYKSKREKNNSSLLSSFIDLYDYAEQLERIYNNISASSFIIIFPEYWSDHFKDATQVSFSFYSQFLVDVNDVLELYLQVDNNPHEDESDFEIFHQKVKVMRIDEHADMGVYQISCQFLSPDEKVMTTLNKALQSQEIIDAYEISQNQSKPYQ